MLRKIPTLLFVILFINFELSWTFHANIDKANSCQSLQNGAVWDCSFKQLHAVPKLSNPKVILVLDLSGNELKSLNVEDFRTYQNLQKLNLSHNLINSIGPETFAQNEAMRILDLSYNDIMFPSVLFSNGSKLLELNLSNNPILDLKGNLFNKLTKLQILDLENIPFPIYFDLDFKDLKEIRHLILNKCTLERVDASTFMPFYNTSLSRLDLAFSLMDSFAPDSLSGLQLKAVIASGLKLNLVKNLTLGLPGLKIQNLSLDHIEPNHIDEITSILYSLKSDSLEYLDFSFNYVRKLDQHILRNATKLKWLSLEGNHLLEIDFDNFAYLGNLETLDISQNYLRNISKTNKTPSLQRLKNLDLSSNQINKLNVKHQPLNFPMLETLKLNENGINELENNSFLDIPHLKQLFLSSAFADNHPLISVNTFNHPNLQVLDLSNNRFQEFDVWFQNATNLTVLNLQNNNFGDLISSGHLIQIFNDLSALEILNLSDCNIAFIPFQQFHRLHSLHTLSLDYNLIAHINLTTFSNLTRMKNFHIAQNNLSTITTPVLKWFDSLSLVDVSDNPFHCDCSLLPFRDWLLSTHINIVHRNDSNFYKCYNSKENIANFNLNKSDCEENKSTFIGSTLFWVLIALSSLIVCIFVLLFLLRERVQQCCSLSHWRSKYSYRMFSGDDLLT